MAENIVRGKVGVVVVYQDDLHFMKCDHLMTIAEVRQMWQQDTGQTISVALLTQDNRYLTDDVTVGEALEGTAGRSLELQAFPKSRYRLQIFGFEDTSALVEVASILTPEAVRHETGRAVGIYTEDFRLISGDHVLDQEVPFNQQGIEAGAQLTIDLRVVVKVHDDQLDGAETRTAECFGSDSIEDLRQRLGCEDDTVLVATSPYRRVLGDTLRVCHVVSELLDLQIPIDLVIERKVLLNFEPITLEHMRQQLLVSLSSTPLDLYNLVRERFDLAAEFRLVVHGQELDNCKPLLNQLLDIDDVIQIDILRSCVVSDLWENDDSDEEVYLYSTESARALFQRDEVNNQRLIYDGINLTIYGTLLDVFGPIGGREKPPLLVDRDIERNIPMLSFDVVMRRFGWANDTPLHIVPSSGGLLPERIMWNGENLAANSTLSQLRLTDNTLLITDPEKVFISSDKRLHMWCLAHGSTFGDVRARMQQMKGCLDIGVKSRGRLIPNEERDRKMDLELYFLTSASRFQTKLTVRMENMSYGCWFEAQQVSFCDIMVSVGKQAKVLPRHLFSRTLFCRGCGRKLSMEEEPHQVVPANCCRVRSLQLTDRRVKEIGIQTAVPRRREVKSHTVAPESSEVGIQTAAPRRQEMESHTVVPESREVGIPTAAQRRRLSKPHTVVSESRDAGVNTESMRKRAIVSATSQCEVPRRPSVSLLIRAEKPEGEVEKRLLTVEGGSKCRAILAAAERQLEKVPVGDSPLVFTSEAIYECDPYGKTKKAIKCFDETSGRLFYADCENGEIVYDETCVLLCRRFLRPTSQLFCLPGLTPVFYIDTETEIFMCSPSRQLSAAPASVLMEPAYVAWMSGIRCDSQYFWELVDGNFVHAASGQVFENLDRIIKGYHPKHIIALLQDKDPVPRCNVPEGRVLFVYRRMMVQLLMESGCVRSVGPPQPTGNDVWDIPAVVDKFLREFSAAARRN